MQPATRWPARKPFFWPGPNLAQPGPFRARAGTARVPCPVSRARAWAGTPARGPARHGTELPGRPGSGPVTPAGQGRGHRGREYITHPPAAPPARNPSPHPHSIPSRPRLAPPVAWIPPPLRSPPVTLAPIPAGERRPARPHPLPPPASRLPFRLL